MEEEKHVQESAQKIMIQPVQVPPKEEESPGFRSLDELLIAKSLDPGNLGIGEELAKIYAAEGSLSMAIDELRLLWLQHPRNDELTLKIARLYLRDQQYQRAFEFFDRTLQLSPAHRQALMEYGEILVAQKRYEESAAILERYKLLDREDLRVYTLLSESYLRVGQVSKAVDNLKQALKQDPFNHRIRLQLAQVFEREQLYAEAIKLLETIENEELTQESSQIRMSTLVDCYIGECQYEKASALLEEYTHSFPQSAGILRKKIRLGRRLDQWNEVELNHRRLLEVDPSYESYSSLADFYLERDEFEHLEKHLLAAHKLFPREADLAYRLGVLYKDDRPDESLDWIENALDLSTENTEEWHYLKGELLIRMGNHEGALQWFTSMREIFPQCDYDERVEELIERDRKYKKTYKILKRAHNALEKGIYKKALEHYRELVSLVPDNPSWMEQLGNLYSVETSYPQAMDCFDKVLKLIRKDKREAMLEKMFYLAYIYNDFERADDCASQIENTTRHEVEFELLRLRIHRHLLAEKAYPLETFEEMMVKQQNRAAGSSNPLVHITLGFSYLYLGSHLLDSDLWSSKAREVFINVLSRKDFRAFYPYAYEGLYLVYLMDNQGEELMDLLRDWVRIDGREKIRKLYLEELIRRKAWKEGLDAVKDFFQDQADSLVLREYSQRFARALWVENGKKSEEKTRHLKALQQVCAENPKDYLAYFDLGLALLYFSDEDADESTYHRVTQAMKKAQKLKGDDPVLETMMLKVVDFAGKLNRQEERLVYSKKRIFLEKAMTKFPEDENLIYEFGKLCLHHEQDRDLGCKYLFKAVTMSPDIVESNMYLGHYFFEKQDLRRAYHYYLKVIEQPVTVRVWGQILDRMQQIL